MFYHSFNWLFSSHKGGEGLMLLEKIYEKNHLCIKFLNIKFKFNLEHLKQLYKKSKNYKNYFVVLKERKKQEKFLKEHLNFINIETFSKCNRQCWFCTNSIIDRHSKNIRMKESLYKKIIDDLAKIKYCGAITYSYYNEPLLDDIIIDRIRYARKKLPNAFLFTHTNGDYINEDYLDKLAYAGLNKLKIQCYLNKDEEFDVENILEKKIRATANKINKSFQVINKSENVIEVKYDYSKMDVQQSSFNFKEIGTNRGGAIENIISSERIEPCFSPFYRMYVTYEGVVLPCCNVRQELNPNFVMGDLRKESLFEVFTNQKYVNLRQVLEKGPIKIQPCCNCVGVAANICNDVMDIKFQENRY